MSSLEIAGYTYGTGAIAKSPVAVEEFELLKKSVLFTEEDERYLRMAGEVLADQIEESLLSLRSIQQSRQSRRHV